VSVAFSESIPFFVPADGARDPLAMGVERWALMRMGINAASFERGTAGGSPERSTR
jgi:hypothetical protein